LIQTYGYRPSSTRPAIQHGRWRREKAAKFEVVVSEPLLDELLEVLSRPRIMKVWQTTVSDAETFVQMVSAVARLVPVSGGLGICRDPDDDVLLETALAGRATYVVSRDEDVTRDIELVRQFEGQGVQLITVSRFLLRRRPCSCWVM